MLYEILKYIRNFFPDTANRKEAQFTILNNSIAPSFVCAAGQYFLIEGSVFNDGVHKLTDTFTNETFTGAITPLKIPKDLLSLVDEITAYSANTAHTDYTSESFGGYSYTRARDTNGNACNWKNEFGTRLNAWRKV